mmetsp:Transcript_10744/g.27562  ORF Transcript_10744/g.27562 Transcript_10744/m.27562 type:complete len:313 (-) Transcript_10744:313-1251(-)|eukprot:jgi/Tetstr1/429125/TSEL_019087.t1
MTLTSSSYSPAVSPLGGKGLVTVNEGDVTAGLAGERYALDRAESENERLDSVITAMMNEAGAAPGDVISWACEEIRDVCGNEQDTDEFVRLVNMEKASEEEDLRSQEEIFAQRRIWMSTPRHATRAEAGRKGILEQLQSAMQLQPESVRVQQETLSAICLLCRNQPDNAAEAGKLDLLRDLQAALREHPEETGVQRWVCGTVANVCAINVENRARGGRLGLVTDLKRVLRASHEHPDVQKLACAAVWALCISNDENKAEAGRIGLLLDISTALTKHASDVELKHYGHGAVSGICRGNKNNRWQALRLGVYNL